MENKLFKQFRKKLLELAHIRSSLSVLNWDQETQMPPRGITRRAQTMSYLSGLSHQKFLSKPFEKLLLRLKEFLDREELGGPEAAIVREVWREFSIARKLPVSFVKKYSELTSNANEAWSKAKGESDFKSFRPYLKKVVDMTRKEAELIGFKDSPYDALLDLYEPGMTAEETSLVLYELKNFLVPFLDKIKNSPVKIEDVFLGHQFPKEKQAEFNKYLIERLGFDFSAGRIDISAHPFATSFHPQDVRITTRYSETNPLPSLFGSIHETGHALYHQGMLSEHFGTPLAEDISLGVNESQSRFWENIIGRSLLFWQHFYPKFQQAFPVPFANVSLETFYRAINRVEPSLVRTEADEVTYNLHVVIRFEIEKDLVEGKIEVNDLPEIWNAKYREYLGLTPPNDSLGVLQDVHWSWGSIGYFPTYTLGNLYSAQFYSAVKRDILNLDELIRQGQFQPLREWLRKNIHVHGRLFTAQQLVKNVTGQALSGSYFTEYIKDKYSAIYQISNA